MKDKYIRIQIWGSPEKNKVVAVDECLMAHEHGINADTALARANIRFQDKVKDFEQKAADWRLLFPFHFDTHQLQCVANFEIGIVYLDCLTSVDWLFGKPV